MKDELRVGELWECGELPDGTRVQHHEGCPVRVIRAGCAMDENDKVVLFPEDMAEIISLPDVDPMTFDGSPEKAAEATEQIITHKSGVKSSYCPEFSMIPLAAMESLAKRYELGAKKYGRNSWRKGIPEVDYVVGRLDHVIRHARLLQMKLQGEIPFDTDDDAGGILWGGAFATEAVRFHFPEIFASFE